MLDASGHLIHIDFGFVFGLAPGKKFSMETAPWKLTVEMVDVSLYIRVSFGQLSIHSGPDYQVLGGRQSPLYEEYLSMVTAGFIEARRHASALTTLISIMKVSSNYPAFR